MSSRIIWIDIAKAAGIFLVVSGHVNSKNIVNDWITSFHMPLFFFLSGLCFTDKRKFLELLRKRTKSLLLPYMYFGIIITILEFYLRSSETILIHLKIKLFNYGAMWFIPVLFVTEMLFYPVNKIGNKYLAFVVLVGSAVAGYALYYFSVILPLSLSACLAALFFYGLGVLGKPHIHLFFAKPYYLILFPFLHLLLLFLSDTTIGMMNNHIPQPVLNYGTAIMGLLSLCVVCYVSSLKMNKKIRDILLYTGQNTLIILCFHMTVIAYSVKILAPRIHNHPLYKGIEFIVVWVFCFMTIYAVHRRFPWMINKSKIS